MRYIHSFPYEFNRRGEYLIEKFLIAPEWSMGNGKRMRAIRAKKMDWRLVFARALDYRDFETA